MERSSRTSSSGWAGAAAGSYAVNAPQADSRQRPSGNAAGGTLMDLVASSSRSGPLQPAGSLSPRAAVPLPERSFAIGSWDPGSGAHGVSHGGMPPAPSGSWREIIGRGDLTSVVAESARRSQHPQFHLIGSPSSPAYGMNGTVWPPVAEAGGSPPAQPAMQPAPSGAWRESLGGSDVMSAPRAAEAVRTPWGSSTVAEPPLRVSVKAERTGPSEQPQFHPRGMGSSMGGGSTWDSVMPLGSAVTEPAGGGSSGSSSRQKSKMHERISAADFERLASLVQGGMSAGSALKVLGRSDLPEGTVRSWLAKAGVMSSGRGGRARALSEAQIAAAAQAQQEFIRENHTSHGSVKAAYEKLGGDRLVTYSAFRQYFHESGLSPYGQTMLEQTRRAEWEAAQEHRSEPPA